MTKNNLRRITTLLREENQNKIQAGTATAAGTSGNRVSKTWAAVAVHAVSARFFKIPASSWFKLISYSLNCSKLSPRLQRLFLPPTNTRTNEAAADRFLAFLPATGSPGPGMKLAAVAAVIIDKTIYGYRCIEHCKPG